MPIRPLAAALFFSLVSLAVPALAAGENEMYTPQQSLAKMKLPEGFKITLFAGEPDVVQPIACTIDDRGRLWVVENLSYPKWQETGNDRIAIYEDTDGDGRFDKKKIFWDKGRYLTGVQLGFGGVYICNAPDLAFIPDKDGDDVPDGPPQVLLDGWSTKGKHNVLNALKWGPDGWLYGCNGITAPSKVGKPGTPDDLRIEINCGVWRYHPTKHLFEVVAHGTTNPWGLDWDQYGQMFVTNCVIKHIFHITPGGHYERMFGQDMNKHSYGLIQSCADHQHWAEGTKWTDSRGGKGAHDAAGGGHAHAGLMIYQGDNWPAEYRGKAFMSNVHGGRINCDSLELKGSGYVASHGKDFLYANDTWFRGLELQYGPDGSVYMTDWHDTGECHDYDKAEVTTGRIYRITYGDLNPGQQQPVSNMSDLALAELLRHDNEWLARNARRILQERAHARKDGRQVDADAMELLSNMLFKEKDPRTRLRAFLTLHAVGTTVAAMIEDPDEHLRSWMVRLAFDTPDRGFNKTILNKMAAEDKSPRVHLELASMMQKIDLASRWPIAEALAAHEGDAKDAQLPLMIWYGIEPAVAQDKARALKLAASTKMPVLRQYIAQRVAAISTAPARPAIIDTVAGDGDKANVGQPFGVEVGPDGALYICDVENHRVHRLDRKTGKLTIVAGTGKKGYSGDGGPATKADLNEPYEIRFDKHGHMFFVEMRNHIVRKVDAKTGVITTIAGTGEQGFAGDGGPATKAKFAQPHSIVIDDRKNHLYIADIGNHRIRRVDLASGVVETIAGTGEKKAPIDGSVATGKAMIGPRALFIKERTMWIALREGHALWKMDLDTMKLTHLSGTGKAGYTGDGKDAKDAQYNGPKGVAVDGDNNIYIVDTENQTIRRIDGKTNIVTTLAGVGPKGRGYGGDEGDATKAKMDRPHGICVDDKGNVYIGDSNNHRVRRVRQ